VATIVLLRRDDTGASGILTFPDTALHRNTVAGEKVSAVQAHMLVFQPWPWNSRDSVLLIM